jgi:hypothetical protein
MHSYYVQYPLALKNIRSTSIGRSPLVSLVIEFDLPLFGIAGLNTANRHHYSYGNINR